MTDDRPRQAVILAGGRGTRVRPLSDVRPKSMIRFHGRPFLAYVLEQLREQGFERVLLLLGYLPEVIQREFGDGSKHGLQIEYSVSRPEDLTATRLALARDRIDPTFLLLYCDNYWPMRFEPMWQRFVRAGAPAMVTVYRNRDRYTADTVRVNNSGYIVQYDPTRSAPGLQGVEISYAILRRDVLELLPPEDALFEQAVYPVLAERGQLIAWPTDHRYYSVGSVARLPVTEVFFARQPTVLLDRDGVVNRRPPRAEYVRRWEEFHWLPGTLEGLRLLHEAGYRVIVVTNQAGVARGLMTEDSLAEVHSRMVADAEAAGGSIEAVYYCPHGWDDGCDCRKPAPGLLYQAQRDFSLDLTRTVMFGDEDRDAEAAAAAGCHPIMVGPHKSLLAAIQEFLRSASHYHLSAVASNVSQHVSVHG